MEYIKESEAKKMINESNVIIELDGEEKGFKVQSLISYKDGSSWMEDRFSFKVNIDSEGNKELLIEDAPYGNWDSSIFIEPKFFDVLRKVMDMVEDKDA